jgi:hypothetical protein
MTNKRGQGLSTNAIVLIILGVLVLALLILGFSIGWAKIFPFLSPGNNVDDIISQCKVACASDSSYNYCTLNKTLNIEDKESITGTCNAFEKKLGSSYGFESCPLACTGAVEDCFVEGEKDADCNGVTEP